MKATEQYFHMVLYYAVQGVSNFLTLWMKFFYVAFQVKSQTCKTVEFV